MNITSPGGGTIYYTLDGSDPRQAFTGNPTGTTYAGAITLRSSGVVKTRTLSASGEWSALTEALFAVGSEEPSPDNLVISEIHYRPASPSPPEISAGHNNRGDFEFLELQNVGSTTVNLSNLVFEDGIDFNFREHSSIFELDPGERVLLVEDLAAFEFRYGKGLPVAGIFQNATDLSNGGETLTMSHGATGAVLQSFSYGDTAPWPEAAPLHA